MKLEDLKDKQIVVLGYSSETESTILFLVKKGFSLTVRTDNGKDQDRFGADYPAYTDKVKWDIASKLYEKLDLYEVIIHESSLMLPERVRSKGGAKLHWMSCLTLFLDELPARLMVVSGGVGKSTAVSIIGKVLQVGGVHVLTAGEDGKLPFEKVVDLEGEDVCLLELPSLACRFLKNTECLILLASPLDTAEEKVLMQVVDKLDQESILLVNAEDPFLEELSKKTTALVLRIGKKPRRQAAWVIDEDSEEVAFLHLGDRVESFSLKERKLVGAHQYPALLAASLLGFREGMEGPQIQRAIRQVGALESRLDWLGSFVGIDFYDDASAGGVDAVEAALEALSQKRVHLIIAGEAGEDYADLADVIVHRCSTVTLLPGEGFQLLRKAIKQALRREKDMPCLLLDKTKEPLFATALSGIQPHLLVGEIVLFSPGRKQNRTQIKETSTQFRQAVRERYRSNGSSI